MPIDADSWFWGVGAEGILLVHGSKQRIFSKGKGVRERSTNGGISLLLIPFFCQVIVGSCAVYAKLLF